MRLRISHVKCFSLLPVNGQMCPVLKLSLFYGVTVIALLEKKRITAGSLLGSCCGLRSTRIFSNGFSEDVFLPSNSIFHL